VPSRIEGHRQVFRVARYRFRATVGARWGGYLALILLVGLVGGLAMATAAAARRTQSSFSAFLASTNPSDLSVTYGGAAAGFDWALVDRLGHLPHVRRVENVALVNVAQVGPDGAAVDNAISTSSGSVDGLVYDQDRMTITQGRMADPQRLDEAVMPAETAHGLGLHVGSVVPVGFYTNEQANDSGYGTASVQPYRRVEVRLVGIGVLNNNVVQDDAERFPIGFLFTPALTRPLLQCCASNSQFSGLKIDHGIGNVAAVETEVAQVLPPGSAFYFRVTSIAEAKVQRAIKPEAIALGVFGGIATLATVLIASQVIGRQLRLGIDDLGVLRALGASPAITTSDGLIGIAGAVIIGSLLAVAVAIGLSPLAPIGPVRPLDPAPGIAFDWTVLGFGLVVLVLGLHAVAAALAYRQAPHRSARREEHTGDRGSTLTRAVSTSGLPAPAATGIRFALEPGSGRNTVPVRSALFGTALAIIVVVGTVTFGASLRKLVSHPALYGWNWDYELATQEGGGTIPQPQAAQLLDHDQHVAAWTGVYFDSLWIDGQTIPIMGGLPGAPLGPPLLSGHSLNAPDEVVLGASTLAQLHKRVGDTVEARYGTLATTTRLRIAGTATMPAVGPGLGLHLSMGSGALVSDQLIPADVRNQGPGRPVGPNAIFVRLRPGASPTASRQSLDQIAATLTSSPTAPPGSVVPVQRPAEIVNYRSMGSTPAFLGAALAAGAVSALGLTLIASVRRRRRDLALLKTLGFTRRQLAAIIAWQSSVAVSIGTVVGIPLGIALGRSLWDLFAREIHVVPQSTVPALTIVLIAVGAIVLANGVAALPGRIAARTPTALMLRAE
jgi:hypothetical protein